MCVVIWRTVQHTAFWKRPSDVRTRSFSFLKQSGNYAHHIIQYLEILHPADCAFPITWHQTTAVSLFSNSRLVGLCSLWCTIWILKISCICLQAVLSLIDIFSETLRFDPRPNLARFVVDKWHWDCCCPQYFGFAFSVSFHQTCKLIFGFRRRSRRNLVTFQKAVLFWISGSPGQKVRSIVLAVRRLSDGQLSTSTVFGLAAIFLCKTATVDWTWISVGAATCATCVCGQAVLSVIWLHFFVTLEVGKV